MLLLRNSERSCWKRCRHQWQWTYLEGRQSLNAPTALRFGDLVHQALAAHFPPGVKRGPDPAATFERLYHEQAESLGSSGFDVFSDDKWAPALDLGRGMLDGYVKRFAAEDREWEVISTEQTFQLPVRAPSGFKFKVVGTFDGVWRHRKNGRLIFKEFKTAAAIKLDGLPMDEQAGLYYTYGPKFLRRRGLLGEDELPSEIMYTFLRKAIPNPSDRVNEDGHRLNQDGSVSKRQPAPYFARVPVYRDANDRARVHARVCAEAEEMLRARAGLVALYKNPGPLHMPNCLGCSVREACEVHETGGDFAAVLDATTIPYDPYAAHVLPERK